MAFSALGADKYLQIHTPARASI